jgi:hypothetical protein
MLRLLSAAMLIALAAVYVIDRCFHPGWIDQDAWRVHDGDMAADFTLKDLAGHDVSLADFRGKPVVLEFGSGS